MSSAPRTVTTNCRLLIPNPHTQQRRFIDSPAKRRVIRAGRRGGKSVGVAILALEEFFDHDARVLYAVPTTDQLGAFWAVVANACAEPVAAGAFRQNLTEHVVENPDTGARIRGKTAWNADSLRGDWASLLILDEWGLMDEDAWELVGAPMMLDTNGTAVFVYTPPSLRSRSVSKAKDPQHAAKMWKRAQAEEALAKQEKRPSRWATFHFKSSDNPYLSRTGLAEISQDMTPLAYRQEILAEDVDQAPGALWTRDSIESHRVSPAEVPELTRTLVAVDPAATSAGDETGILGGGQSATGEWYVLRDGSLQARPEDWAAAAVAMARELKAPAIAAEGNQGGEMVVAVINAIAPDLPVLLVYASDGKQPRAVPVSVMYAQGKVHHVGAFNKLEDELCVTAGTMVATPQGEVPIEAVLPGDMVLTRRGYRRVVKAGMTKPAAEVLRIRTRGGRLLLATCGHPIYSKTARAFIPAGQLRPGDALEVASWHTHHWQRTNGANRSSSTGNGGSSLGADTTSIGGENSCIGRRGTERMAPFLMGRSCTTRTATNSTGPSTTLNSLPARATSTVILAIGGRTRNGRGCRGKGASIGSTPRSFIASARSAERRLPPPAREGGSANWTVSDDTITNLRLSGRARPVYNLQVEGEQEYFANGILVHNCLWTPGDPSPNRLDALVWLLSTPVTYDGIERWAKTRRPKG